MDKSKVQDIFNSTAVRDIELEIVSMQHDIEKKRFSSVGGQEVIKCLLVFFICIIY